MKVAPQITTAKNVNPGVTPKQITSPRNVNPGLKALKPKGAPSATIKTAPTKPTTLSKPSTTLGRKTRPPIIEEPKYKPVAKPAAVTAPKLKAGPTSPRVSSQSSYSSTSKPTASSMSSQRSYASTPKSTTASTTASRISGQSSYASTSKDSSLPQLKAKLKMGSKLSAYASGSSSTPKKTGARLTRRSRR
jgi:hypothetical protein